jgi:hypothetical protein
VRLLPGQLIQNLLKHLGRIVLTAVLTADDLAYNVAQEAARRRIEILGRQLAQIQSFALCMDRHHIPPLNWPALSSDADAATFGMTALVAL